MQSGRKVLEPPQRLAETLPRLSSIKRVWKGQQSALPRLSCSRRVRRSLPNLRAQMSIR